MRVPAFFAAVAALLAVLHGVLSVHEWGELSAPSLRTMMTFVTPGRPAWERAYWAWSIAPAR